MNAIRRILITGANKGIGLATVQAVLNAHDDTHVFLGSRDVGRGESAREHLVADHPNWESRIEVLELDVTLDASVISAAERVAKGFGQGCLYGIVNNAGVGEGTAIKPMLDVNIWGPRRVCDAFIPLLAPKGRVVNISSAWGPFFVAACDAMRQRLLTNPNVRWEELEALMTECLNIDQAGGDPAKAGLGDGAPYGLSKACLNAYTIALARTYPDLRINACTPGFIETDMSRQYAEKAGVAPAELGMKQPAEGTKAVMRLLFEDLEASGWYFGSDAERSPLDAYRSPGDPPYQG